MESIEPGASIGKGASAAKAPTETSASAHSAHNSGSNGTATSAPVDEDAPLIGGIASPASTPSAPPSVSAALPESALPEPSPFLRIWRLLGGVGALLVAWVTAVAVYLLVVNAATMLANIDVLPFRLAAAVGGAIVVVWLAIAFFSCAVAGAYCVLLAVTHRRW